ncbi:STAS domain-containing protein [Pyxidicoccus xibeiensis]|uniref:STAS domain-containing protein n=1 Tax=Pyxidicoccus xibeiensis TaxID=2906759 RepID=UPI0020A78FE8|nr:STAS domain-containing protein [Pyxidicoccus xibeiensis]MCP3145046.1 STAS domain-containing protein [Pyxidicoccus xibeiensis]
MNQVLEVRRRAADATVGTDRVETLMLEGELGEQDLLQLCDELTRKLHRGVRQVVLDFGDVGHLNYRGVKPLMARAEAFRRTGGDLKLSGLSPYLAAIFRAAGAHDTFEIYPHMNDARAAFALARAPFV